MKSVLLIAAALFSLNTFAEAPQVFEGYCMVVHPGTPPGADVAIKKGSSYEIAKEGDVTYTVKYGDSLGDKDVFQLVTLDTKLNKQDVADIFIDNEFPRRMDLVGEVGSISCQRN